MVFGGLAHGLLGVLAEQGLHPLAPAEWRRELRVGKSAGVGSLKRAATGTTPMS